MIYNNYEAGSHFFEQYQLHQRISDMAGTEGWSASEVVVHPGASPMLELPRHAIADWREPERDYVVRPCSLGPGNSIVTQS